MILMCCLCRTELGYNGRIKKDQGSILLPQVHQSSWSSYLWYIILSPCGIEVMFMMFVLVLVFLAKVLFPSSPNH
jgi:hypothetical protein